jgi:serine phosphatase RsbU (regulator of sigma subunit)
VLLIPLLAYNAYDRYQQYVADLNTAEFEQTSTALMLAQAMDVFIERTVTLQHSVGQALLQLQENNCSNCDTYMQSVLSSSQYLRGVAFADPTGKVVYAAPKSLIGRDISSMHYFDRIRTGTRWTVSEFPIPVDQWESGFDVVTGVRSLDGNLLGILVFSVDEDAILTALHAHVRPQTLFVLVNKSGRVVLTSGELELPPKDRQWKDYSFVQTSLHGANASVEKFELAGMPVLTGAMVPVSSVGWAVGAFVPFNQVVAPVISQTVQDFLLILLVLISTFVLGSILARQLTTPIRSLSETAEQLGHGNFQVRSPVSNTTELATLATTMNNMAQSIQQRDEELRQAYERERRIASVLQQRMLPQLPSKFGRLRIATGYFPASEEAELGGDFYDAMLLPDGSVGLVIADVSGKGLSAAVHTATAKYMLEGFAHDKPDPALVLTKLNNSMNWYQLDDQQEKFVTLFFGIVNPETGHMLYANAGHPPPLVRHNDGAVEWLDKTSGFPLGVVSAAEYSNGYTQLAENDALVLYTDGVIEAHRKDRWFNSESLANLVSGADLAPSDLVDAIYQTASDFIHSRIPDDVALIVVKLEADTTQSS